MRKTNRTEFHNSMKQLKSVYTQSNFLANQDSYDTWYFALGKTDIDRLNDAIARYITSNKMPPTPSDIKDLLVKGDAKEPVYSKMILWGLYDQDGNEENEVYAPPEWSNLVVKAWFGKAQNIEGYTVRAKFQKAAEVTPWG